MSLSLSLSHFIWLNSFAGISIRVHPLGYNQLLHLDSDMFFPLICMQEYFVDCPAPLQNARLVSSICNFQICDFMFVLQPVRFLIS
jgi:hypothetical protein